jgi:glucose/arabinose dehydrogenase
MNVFKTSIAFAAAVVFAGAVSPARAQLAKATLIDTFVNPVYVTAAPGTPRLLFVVEKAGVIHVLRDEVTGPVPFLDISSLVSTAGERGLLSIAFAPDYATSRLFYVAFTNLTGDLEINEYQRRVDKTMRADPSSRRFLLRVPHQESLYHNGGQLAFGPDGLLYISTGDGAEVFPRGKYARDLNSLLGKILRIDPTPDGDRAYTIPADNPYVGMQRRREIFAYGLRNPWRFSFDGNRIAIGDVGQGNEEEINFLAVGSARGANFGWPAFEGDAEFDQLQPAPPDDPTFPMHTYTQAASGGCAVIGGYVSRDPNLPALARRYVYGDFCNGQIRAFVPGVPDQEARGDRLVLSGAHSLTSLGVGPDQRMYFTQNNTGALMRIDPLP